MKYSALTSFTPISFLLSSAFAQTNANCPLLGPVFSPASSPSLSKAVQNASSNFAGVLKEAFSSGLLDNQTTSFSISVFSASDNSTLYTHHFSAPALNGSLPGGQLDENTIYRLGSLSKVLTVYGILAKNGDIDFSEPITKYVPELAAVQFDDAIDTVHWSEITVGALASQLAGISRDYALNDLANVAPKGLGLPPIANSSIPPCGIVNQNKGLSPCGRSDLLAGLTSEKPQTASFNTPIYSNAGFVLLGYVLENITNSTYAEAMQELVFGPLNLTRTSVSTPQDDNIITPFGPQSNFALQIGDAAPAGGLYASLTDINTIGRSILNSEILSKTLTQRWMKPHGLISNPTAAVGAPWEIERVSTPVSQGSNTTRLVDLYTKAGDLGLYSTMLALDVDHSIGFSILTAGKNTNPVRYMLASLLAETFLPALEEAAREEAEAKYSGTYAFSSKDFNATLKLSTDDRPGLGLEIDANGADFRQLLAGVRGPAYANASLRLYPTGLKAGKRMKMNAGFDPEAKESSKPFLSSCISWFLVNSPQYGGVGLDEFEVAFGEDGRVHNVTSLGFRLPLTRVS
ncbi:beta-lactamase/transpeptidase-like protein [Clohesyomyces aquaticus]|uniref:Beta-lactamase/transpeptidase-like protein n=1 Tax=Clohesyomyces aquaticus TaxID=1231657 RepID=A0A1Y1YN74_9PLEO|nr:beta-lactamase/transpeptidase-like protein [Clohesyomyces aquaticus]